MDKEILVCREKCPRKGESMKNIQENRLKISYRRCMGCEMCARACAEFMGIDRDFSKQSWNIILKNGKAVIKDHQKCQEMIPTCKFSCLEQCPTKALRAEFFKKVR